MRHFPVLFLCVPAFLILPACSDDDASKRAQTPMFDAGGSSDSAAQVQPDAKVVVADTNVTVVADTGVEGVDASADTDAANDGPVYSGALEFDGINDIVELPTAASMGANETAFSVEVWFNTTAPTGAMFEVYGAGGTADRFIFLDTGKVCFYVYGTPVTHQVTHDLADRGRRSDVDPDELDP